MSLIINNKSIQRVMVVAHKPDSLDEIAYSIEDAELEPIIYSKPLTSIQECLSIVTKQAEAAIFAHHLGPNLTPFSGAAAVAQLHKQQFPALLITAWVEADIDNIQKFIQDIPVIIRSSDATSETIVEGLWQCCDEFENRYSAERKTWRTILNIEEVNRRANHVYAIIPGWCPDEIVRLPLAIFPEYLQADVDADTYFFAEVNIGAKHQSQLYFQNFERAKKSEGEYAKFLRS
jgi:hypothetical protein